MNAVEALCMARESGVHVGIAGTDLILDANQEPASPVPEALRRHKAEIVALLTIAEDDWTAEDWRVFYDGRAGIAEFDGELDRAGAERQAFETTITRWMNTHLPEGLDPDTCAACGHPIGEIGKAAITIWRGAMMEDLTEQFENVLESCFESGMQVPLILAAVAVNGSVLVVRFVWNESHEDLDSEVLAKHLEDTGLTPPINIMVVDSVGEGACVLIEQKGFKYRH